MGLLRTGVAGNAVGCLSGNGSRAARSSARRLSGRPPVVPCMRLLASSVSHISQATAQRLGTLVGREAQPTGAPVAQRGHEGDQRVTSFADVREVRLHLLAWRHLESHKRLHRFSRWPWMNCLN